MMAKPRATSLARLRAIAFLRARGAGAGACRPRPPSRRIGPPRRASAGGLEAVTQVDSPSRRGAGAIAQVPAAVSRSGCHDPGRARAAGERGRGRVDIGQHPVVGRRSDCDDRRRRRDNRARPICRLGRRSRRAGGVRAERPPAAHQPAHLAGGSPAREPCERPARRPDGDLRASGGLCRTPAAPGPTGLSGGRASRFGGRHRRRGARSRSPHRCPTGMRRRRRTARHRPCRPRARSRRSGSPEAARPTGPR